MLYIEGQGTFSYSDVTSAPSTGIMIVTMYTLQQNHYFYNGFLRKFVKSVVPKSIQVIQLNWETSEQN